MASEPAQNWGDIHQAVFNHPLLSESVLGCLYDRTIYKSGSIDSPNVGYFSGETWSSHGGPSYRQIIDFDELENSLFIMPLGTAGGFFSDYYENLLSKWAGDEYILISNRSSNIRTIAELRP